MWPKVFVSLIKSNLCLYRKKFIQVRALETYIPLTALVSLNSIHVQSFWFLAMKIVHARRPLDKYTGWKKADFSSKTYVVGSQRNHLNMGKKILTILLSNMLLILT